MERLTKREISGITYNNSTGFMCSCYCDNCSKGTGDCDRLKAMVNRLAKLEDLEEQGLLVRLPCKIGEKLWCIINGRINELRVYCFDMPAFGTTDIVFRYADGFRLKRFVGNLGKTVFLTREEAEKKLEEMKGEHDAGRNHY